MPRYSYVCNVCNKRKIIFHLSTENPEIECSQCESGNILERAVTIPYIMKEQQTDYAVTKIGQLTEDYIKQNKELLEEEKVKAREETYEPT